MERNVHMACFAVKDRGGKNTVPFTILRSMISPSLFCKKNQVTVFSAIMPSEAAEIIHKFMNKPVRILVKGD